ncbi:Glycosylphosphatidylinositol (GPI) anchor assembly protein [Xylographa bjoerkii]|nr:Glycosylphosphatidylinositol (GPI) anchor assembly protein [Xylographa bjoerkii]
MSTNTDSTARTIVPVSQPIGILPSLAARTFSHVHPVLLSAYYYLRFASLVANPVSTLITDLLPVCLLQLIYAVICLPPTKNISTTTPSPKHNSIPRPKTPKVSGFKRSQLASQKPWQDMPSKLSTGLLALMVTFLASTPTIMILMVLFGAPLTTHHLQTYLCASHLSILAVFPLFYVHGVSGTMWREIAGGMLPFDDVWGGTIGDREWQKWPITIVTGAYMGYVAGKFAFGYLLRGKRISFD